MGKAIGGNAVIERRIAAAQGLGGVDGHGLAGFLDAEGCFQIVPNNQGRTWSCCMTLALRLDEACWTVASKRECAHLTRILREFPLRARKRRDFDIWARAVDRWAASPYDAKAGRAFHAGMAHDAAALRDVRRYVKLPPPAMDGSTEDLLAYFGGFFSGEGCFSLASLQPRAVVKLRRDDRGILELFEGHFGLGTVRDNAAYGGDNESVTWLICATEELAAAVRLFEAAELRGRKRREFEVWREAAEERAFARVAGRPLGSSARSACRGPARGASRLSSSAPYRCSDAGRRGGARCPRGLHRGPARLRRRVARREADVQRARAGDPEWPTRNTLALAFGTWEQALAAAGLGSRASDWRRVRRRTPPRFFPGPRE